MAIPSASGEAEDLDSPESLHQFQSRRVVLDTTQQQQHHPSRKRVVVERRVARHIRGSNSSHYSNLISPNGMASMNNLWPIMVVAKWTPIESDLSNTQ